MVKTGIISDAADGVGAGAASGGLRSDTPARSAAGAGELPASDIGPAAQPAGGSEPAARTADGNGLAALRRHEKYLKLLLENCPESILMLDGDGKIAYCSGALLRLACIGDESAIAGKPLRELYRLLGDEAFVLSAEARYRSVKENLAPVTTRKEIKFPSHGEEHLYMIQTVPMLDGNGCFDGVLAIYFDATEIRDAEVDERTRVMLGATPLACSLLDSDGVLLDCNDETLRMFGMSDRAEYGRRQADLSPIFQPDGSRSEDRSQEHEREAIKAGYQRFEWMHNTILGEPLPTEVTLVRVPWKDGFGIAAYCRDLRDIKQKERQMREADAYARELEIANRAAIAAAEAKSRFFAAMSHEIRTPMNAIIGMSELIRTDNLDGTQQAYFTDIRKMSRSLLQIINDILDISKLEAGKMDITASDYDVHALYDNICSVTRFTLGAKPLEFRHSIADDIPRALYGDMVRVRQVVTNILSNAIKYTQAGFVSLSFSRASKRRREYLSIRVEDTGMGIRGENFARLFDAFEQFDREKNKEVVGTGLGLSITKRLVDMMGGEISVESEYGKGSVFTVLLPLVEGDAAKAESVGDVKLISRFRGAAVLVVDDNAANLTVATGFLQRHGIAADTAASGAEALDRVRARQYDLVLMDHMMPEMDGIEATAAIRALDGGRFAKLPIVALTANAIAGMREAFLGAGLDDFITKPIDASELNAVLLKWLPPEKLAGAVDGADGAAGAEGVDGVEGAEGTVGGDGAPEGTDGAGCTDSADGADGADGEPEGTDGTDGAGAKAEAAAKSAALVAKLVGIDDLSVTTGLSRVGGNKSVYVKIMRQFCELLDGDIANIRSCAAKEDWKGYSIRVHGIKSVFSNIGNKFMADWALDLENASRFGDPGKCARQTDDFCHEMLRFRVKLEKSGLMDADGQEKAAKKPVSANELSEKLALMESACMGCDTDGAEALARELRDMAFREDVEGALARICDLADAFDYGEAAELCAAATSMVGLQRNMQRD
jgi:PAS domain S-box-containing protein